MAELGTFPVGLLDVAAAPCISRTPHSAHTQINREPNLIASVKLKTDKRVDTDMGNLHEYLVRYTDRQGALIDGETFLAVSIVDATTRAKEVVTEIAAASFVITSKREYVSARPAMTPSPNHCVRAPGHSLNDDQGAGEAEGVEAAEKTYGFKP
jgi:hypothetical protein